MNFKVKGVSTFVSTLRKGASEREMATLKERLGFLETLSVNVGEVIGSGIYMFPGLIFALAGAGGSILVWILMGIATLLEALIMMVYPYLYPDAGGWYVYLREGLRGELGEATAFLFGWYNVFILPASTAAIAIGFSSYLNSLLQLPNGVVGMALVLTVFLALVNLVGVELGGKLSDFLTGLKIIPLILLGVAGLALGGGLHLDSLDFKLDGFGLAMMMAWFAYSGFDASVPLAEETKDGRVKIPLSLPVTVVLVMVLYVIVVLSTMTVLPPDILAKSEEPLLDEAKALGSWWPAIALLGASLSMAGSCASEVISRPRVTYAMARDGQFFRIFSQIHGRFLTPYTSILLYAFIMLIYELSGSYVWLVKMVTVPTLLFSLLMYLGIFRLKRYSEVPRPFNAIGHPITTAVVIAIYSYVLYSLFLDDPLTSSLSLIVVFAGLPIYIWWRARWR